MLTPSLIADLLILAYVAMETVRWRLGPRSASISDRGTALVFRGGYVIALLALNTTVLSPVTAKPLITWIGVAVAACGLGVRIAARDGTGWRHACRLGKPLLWIGVTTASGNLVAALTVTVAMLAATGVLLSVDAAEEKNLPVIPAEGKELRDA